MVLSCVSRASGLGENLTKPPEAAILESGFEVMHHPPYSPDLAPSDYHLFPNLKQHLRGQRFSTDDELKYATEQWLNEQSELLFHRH